MQDKVKIADLSTHLFWDVDKDSLDFERSKKLIIHRVLEYGLLQDWKLLVKEYGIAEIAGTATTFRNLDAQAMNFIALISGTPTSSFRCYTTRQSHPPQGNS